jgi:hypothetical protein
MWHGMSQMCGCCSPPPGGLSSSVPSPTSRCTPPCIPSSLGVQPRSPLYSPDRIALQPRVTGGTGEQRGLGSASYRCTDICRVIEAQISREIQEMVERSPRAPLASFPRCGGRATSDIGGASDRSARRAAPQCPTVMSGSSTPLARGTEASALNVSGYRARGRTSTLERDHGLLRSPLRPGCNRDWALCVLLSACTESTTRSSRFGTVPLLLPVELPQISSARGRDTKRGTAAVAEETKASAAAIGHVGRVARAGDPRPSTIGRAPSMASTTCAMPAQGSTGGHGRPEGSPSNMLIRHPCWNAVLRRP